MKKQMFVLKPISLAILLVGVTFLLAGNLVAQDTVPAKQQKVIKIKVDKDGDGESVSIDTTFVIENDFDMQQFEKAMKEYEIQMVELGKNMKELEIEIDSEEMEKAMQEAHTALRGIYAERPHRGQFQRGPRGDRHFFDRSGCCQTYRIHSPKRGETLSDVLGHIPMSAVTNYKVKETKNGKRITIEVSDDALMDVDEDILIWTGEVPPPPPPPRLRKNVWIEKEVEKEEDPE